MPPQKAKHRDADRYSSDHAKAMAEIAKLDSKIASEQKKQLDAQQRLDQEVAKQKKKKKKQKKKKHLAVQKKK
jgi:hypothetical protein